MKKAAFFLLTSIVSIWIPVTADAAGYKVAAVTDGGSVSGKVTYTGKDPAPV